ncbi:endodeoxyribonuclease [Tulasnella sp. 332]|nr:endodeoxyribonuclease [Tulasnella sp. 332]
MGTLKRKHSADGEGGEDGKGEPIAEFNSSSCFSMPCSLAKTRRAHHTLSDLKLESLRAIFSATMSSIARVEAYTPPENAPSSSTEEQLENSLSLLGLSSPKRRKILNVAVVGVVSDVTSLTYRVEAMLIGDVIPPTIRSIAVPEIEAKAAPDCQSNHRVESSGPRRSSTAFAALLYDIPTLTDDIRNITIFDYGGSNDNTLMTSFEAPWSGTLPERDHVRELRRSSGEGGTGSKVVCRSRSCFGKFVQGDVVITVFAGEHRIMAVHVLFVDWRKGYSPALWRAFVVDSIRVGAPILHRLKGHEATPTWNWVPIVGTACMTGRTARALVYLFKYWMASVLQPPSAFFQLTIRMDNPERIFELDEVLDDPYWDGLMVDFEPRVDTEDEEEDNYIYTGPFNASTPATLLGSQEDLDVKEVNYVDDLDSALDDPADDDTVASNTSDFGVEGLSTQEYAIACLEAFALSFLSQLDDTIVDDLPEGSIQADEDPKTPVPSDKVILELIDRTSPISKRPTEDGCTPLKALQIPKRRKNNTRKMAALLRVVGLSHEALVNDIPTTKRDMFYKDLPIFRKQSVVDKLVDDLAATFELTRSDLNVRASSKGLFAGSSLTIGLRRGGEIKGLDYEGSLIPCDAEIAALALREHVSWVLVIEKEAIFQTLCRIGFTQDESLFGPGIIVTGKGYPDVATRQLLSEFSKHMPAHIPLLALVDADPHGLDILSVFKFGSASMEHERETLEASRLEHIGVSATELHSQELIHMLHIRRKAEIEVVCSASASIVQHGNEHQQHLIDHDSQAFEHCAMEDQGLAFDLDLDLDLDATALGQQRCPELEAYNESLHCASDATSETEIGKETLTGAPLVAAYLAYKINAAIDELRSKPGADYVGTDVATGVDDHGPALDIMEEFI